MDNSVTFGQQAALYAQTRPYYPEELFQWIASNAPANKKVWDVGTGNGQAAIALVEHFKKVHASDPDTRQISHAKAHEHIKYDVSDSSNSSLEADSVDAITVATALHWFDFDTFWDEVTRVSKPDALFVAWTYHRIQCDEQVRSLLINPVLEIINPYWSYGNELSWRGYPAQEIKIPFAEITMPEFTCQLNWTPNQVSGFVKSWSAHKKARDAGFSRSLQEIETNALEKLGTDAKAINLPIVGIAARVNC